MPMKKTATKKTSRKKTAGDKAKNPAPPAPDSLDILIEKITTEWAALPFHLKGYETLPILGSVYTDFMEAGRDIQASAKKMLGNSGHASSFIHYQAGAYLDQFKFMIRAAKILGNRGPARTWTISYWVDNGSGGFDKVDGHISKWESIVFQTNPKTTTYLNSKKFLFHAPGS